MNAEFIFPKLTQINKKKMLRYAAQVLEMQLRMTDRERNILHYTLQEKSEHQRIIHYPKGDRIDHATGAQYFYHCHRENQLSMEHGHFHCFLRYSHIPKRITPTPLADWDKYIDNPMTHLVAIAMNCVGQPIRLFTVNRWVTSEIWYDAKHVSEFMNQFKITSEDPYWTTLDKWLEGILHIFSPQISWLLEQRDKKINEYKTHGEITNPFVRQDIEELSEIEVDLKKQIEWVMGSNS